MRRLGLAALAATLALAFTAPSSQAQVPGLNLCTTNGSATTTSLSGLLSFAKHVGCSASFFSRCMEQSLTPSKPWTLTAIRCLTVQ
jgi:hypothetical protein